MNIEELEYSEENYLGSVNHSLDEVITRRNLIERQLAQLDRRKGDILPHYDESLADTVKLVNGRIVSLFKGPGYQISLHQILSLIEPFIQNLSKQVKTYQDLAKQVEVELNNYVRLPTTRQSERSGKIVNLVQQMTQLPVFTEQRTVPGIGTISLSGLDSQTQFDKENISFEVSLVRAATAAKIHDHVNYPEQTETVLFSTSLITLTHRLSKMLKNDLASLGQSSLRIPTRDPFVEQITKAVNEGYNVMSLNYLNRIGLVIYNLNLAIDLIVLPAGHGDQIGLEGLLDIFKGKENLEKISKEHLEGWDRQVEWLEDWFYKSTNRNSNTGPDTDLEVEVPRQVYECVKGGRKGSSWNMTIQNYIPSMRKVLHGSGRYFDEQIQALKPIRDLLKQYSQSPSEETGRKIIEAFKAIPGYPKAGEPTVDQHASVPYMNGFRARHDLGDKEYGTNSYGRFRLVRMTFSQYGTPDMDHVDSDNKTVRVHLPRITEYVIYMDEVNKFFKELLSVAKKTNAQHQGLLKQDLSWMRNGDRFFNNMSRAYLDAVGLFVTDRQFTILNVMNSLNAWYELGFNDAD